jgi:hypothetical protein
LREGAMPIHRFQVGQTAVLNPSISQNLLGGAYVVIKKLPQRDGEFEHRVKKASTSRTNAWCKKVN